MESITINGVASKMGLRLKSFYKARLKTFSVSLIFCLLNLAYQPLFGQYPPQPGQPGSTAIVWDTAIIKAWATGCEVNRGYIQIDDPSIFHQGANRPLSNRATFGTPSLARGTARPLSTHVVSLGDGGSALLTFDRPIVDGPGFDFAVFENSFSDYYLELAYVEVSSDCINFTRFPSVSLTQTQTQVGTYGLLDPTQIHNLAGKYRQGYGTPFDLSDLAGSPNLDLNNIRYVRIVDVVGTLQEPYARFDALGNKINDPYPTPFWTGGFDLDAVAVINGGPPYQVVDFEDLTIGYNSFWNGSNGSGGFTSGSLFFPNSFDPTFQSWSGWAFSTMTDTITPGYTNQYSAFTLSSFETGGAEGDSSVYAVSYVAIDWMSGNYNLIPNQLVVSSGNPVVVQGLYATNNTYAALLMKHGDAFTKKFGGPTGNDPDWFKLIIRGFDANNSITGIVEFFLADYRFPDNSLDYVVQEWRWVDLSSLGAVVKLDFSLASTDTGIFGMNTPAYFCIDRLTLAPVTSTSARPVLSSNIPNAYPNPFTNQLTLEGTPGDKVLIVDMQSIVFFETILQATHQTIDTRSWASGLYVMISRNRETTETVKLIKVNQ